MLFKFSFPTCLQPVAFPLDVAFEFRQEEQPKIRHLVSGFSQLQLVEVSRQHHVCVSMGEYHPFWYVPRRLIFLKIASSRPEEH